MAQWRDVVGEHAHQEIGEADATEHVDAPAARVGTQHGRAADLARRGVAAQARQFPGVAQADVEPLPRDRMQRLRGVADAHHAVGRLAAAVGEPQREGLARAGGQEKALAPAEVTVQGSEKFSVRELGDTLGVFLPGGPHQGVAIALRQQRRRTLRGETLVGLVGVRQLGPHFAHHRRLVVVAFEPGSGRRVSLFTVAAAPTIGHHHQRRGMGAAVGRMQGRHVSAGFDARHRRAVLDRDAGIGQRPFQRRGQRSVRQHIAECRHARLVGRHPRHAERAALRNMDAADRGDVLKRVPHPEAFEDQARAMRQRQGAGVGARVGGLRFEHVRENSLLLQRQRAHRADRAGADDQHRIHPFIHASISATVFGGVVSTSQPDPVTATSSSMRMPMFHSASGTSSAGRM